MQVASLATHAREFTLGVCLSMFPFSAAQADELLDKVGKLMQRGGCC